MFVEVLKQFDNEFSAFNHLISKNAKCEIYSLFLVYIIVFLIILGGFKESFGQNKQSGDVTLVFWNL